MTRVHRIINGFDIGPLVAEYLLVIQHPVSIEKHNYGRPFEYTQYFLTQVITEQWWFSAHEGKSYLLHNLIVSQIDCSHWEHNWHSNTKEHCHENNIELVTVQKADVNVKVSACIHFHKLMHIFSF